MVVGQKRKAESMLDYEQYYPTMLPLRGQGQELTEEEMLEAPVGPPDLAAEQVCRPEACAGSPAAGCASSHGGLGPPISASGLAIEVPGLGLLACLPACPIVYASSASPQSWWLINIMVMLVQWLLGIGSFGLASTPL